MSSVTSNDDELTAAAELVRKLRGFVAELGPTERRLFAALVAPGVARAHAGEGDRAGGDVVGFGMTEWSPQQLPAALARAIREADIRVEGL